MLASLSPRQLHQYQHRFARRPLQHRHSPNGVVFAGLELASSPPSRMKTRNNANNGSVGKMDLLLLKRGRLPNHTELAYREAVAKLKYLLAESYAPRALLTSASKRPNIREPLTLTAADEYGEDEAASQSCATSLASEAPSKLVEPQSTRSGKLLESRKPGALPAPAELRSLIERQEDYIEQLEKESQYCREELRALVDKVREVVAENEALQDKSKTHFFKSADLEDQHTQQSQQQQQHQTKQPSIVLESRVSELEAQLTQSRLELRQAREGIRTTNEPEDESQLRVELERERRERRDLETRVEERDRELARLRGRDAEAQLRARRAGELAQQADCQRLQAELELARLRDELERRQDKLREALQEGGRRLAEEKQQAERRFGQQLEQLSAELANHWQAASASRLQADQQERRVAELTRELAQSQTRADDLSKELQQKTAKLQEQLDKATSEKDTALEQLNSLRLSSETNERQARQEQARLQAELSSCRARLDRAEAELLHAKREQMRLGDEVAALEKQINMNKVVEETRVQGALMQPSANKLLADKSKEERDKDKELAALIYDLESKHNSSARTVADLEDNLNQQVALVARLTDQCSSLTQRLETNDRKHEEEMASLQSKIEYLSSKIRESLEHDNELTPKLRTSEQPVNELQCSILEQDALHLADTSNPLEYCDDQPSFPQLDDYDYSSLKDQKCTLNQLQQQQAQVQEFSQDEPSQDGEQDLGCTSYSET